MKAIFESSIMQIALATSLIAGVYVAANASTAPLQALPISSLRAHALQHLASQDMGELANLYPLKAKAPPAAPSPAAANADDVIPVDDAFLPRAATPKQENKTAAVDYFPLLKSNNVLALQATTDTGAIINQEFYPCDSVLAKYAYPGPKGSSVAPRLICTKKPDTVRIAEPATIGKRYFDLSLHQAQN